MSVSIFSLFDFGGNDDGGEMVVLIPMRVCNCLS